MPLYDYHCEACGHLTTRLVPYRKRDAEVLCEECNAPTVRLFPAPHIGPDGMYSYAPNIGSKDAFDRKQHIIEERKAAKEEGRKPKV